MTQRFNLKYSWDMNQHLPKDIISRASLLGREYAWHIDDIPALISAARAANLVNVGGQLQFRLPEATCECYWIAVDTLSTIDATLSWRKKVQTTADEALRQFETLKTKFDFLAEGQQSFGKHFDVMRASGGNPADHMCFVWYVESEEEAQRPQKRFL